MTLKSSQINGLILAGGFSRRMGQEKSLIVYRDRPQLAFLHALLQDLCAQVRVSLRADQVGRREYQDYLSLMDDPDVEGIGPLAGILTAFSYSSEHPWLVLACDLPFVDATTLDYLISQRNPEAMATAFISSSDGMPEPLCAIWEPAIIPEIIRLKSEGIHCPRKILMRTRTHLISLGKSGWLDNVNTPQELAAARARLAAAAE